MLKNNYRVALLCSGISHVQRGFETFIADLALALEGCCNVCLFQGSGRSQSPKAITLPTLRRNSRVMRWFGPKLEDKRYRFEQLSFVVSGWVLGHWPKYDLIYYCDPDIGDALYKLRKRFGYKYRLLYGNCSPTSPGYREKRVDYIQQFSADTFDEALAAQVPASKMALLPMGINAKRFETTVNRRTLRAKYHVPDNKFVILAVSSLDDRFKRLQWLIETIAELGNSSFYLLLVGQHEKTPHSSRTLELADRCLPGQYQHLTIPHKQITDVYKVSDLFVHPALQEGFGKVYLEAVASQIPVLCHNSNHTRWLIAHEFSRIDMENRRACQEHIHELKGNDELQKEIVRRNYQHLVAHFDWRDLRNKYLDMFRAVIS